MYKIDSVIGFKYIIVYFFYYYQLITHDLIPKIFVCHLSIHSMSDVLLISHICDWHDNGRYVVLPNNLLLDVCMCVVLKLVVLLLFYLHKRFLW